MELLSPHRSLRSTAATRSFPLRPSMKLLPHHHSLRSTLPQAPFLLRPDVSSRFSSNSTLKSTDSLQLNSNTVPCSGCLWGIYTGGGDNQSILPFGTGFVIKGLSWGLEQEVEFTMGDLAAVKPVCRLVRTWKSTSKHGLSE